MVCPGVKSDRKHLLLGLLLNIFSLVVKISFVEYVAGFGANSVK